MVRDAPERLNEFLRIDAAIEKATEMLSAASESPRLDAELLLARALDVQRSYLFAHPEDEMDESAAMRFSEIVVKRREGMPMAYIAGEQEFWSMPLVVTPATLVPRPETETLVEQVLSRLPRRATARVLELGTGSGAIALALAKERPACQVTATDVSADALAVARENARRLLIPNVEFREGDWLEPVRGMTFDIVVSNPPYVATGDLHLARLGFEPRGALEAGVEGLDAIRQISAESGTVLDAAGWLLLEHGATQVDAVVALLSTDGWHDIDTVRDLAGLPRVTVAKPGAG
jgi:release factor glutamine methyltransferase